MKFVINGQLLEAKSLAYFAAKPYVLLRPIFEALGGIISWQAREHQAVVTWQSNHIVVPATGRNIIINGQMHAVKEAHHLVDGRLWVSLADLAELLRGTLRQEAEQLSLFLPSSFLTGISVSKEALTFHGVGSSRLLLSAEDTPGVYTLVDAAWNMPLRSITIRQSPQGFLQLQLEAGGSPLGAHFTETELRFTWPRPEQELAGLVIVVALDAGHGGQQPGAVGTTGVLEKNLTRLVVDLLAMRLRAAGALVVDVRPGDETVSLAQRGKRSQVAQAQIFLSVHYNAHKKSTANGIETFYVADNARAGQLARLVQEELVASLNLRDRGVKQSNFQVLRAQGQIPAVLTELGFITNPGEEEFLLRQGASGLKAEALYRAILRYSYLGHKQ